jgi:hypothetical protein
MDHNKDIVDVSHKDPISFFEKNERFVFVYKKTEKLATALYMVTNLFSDSEPMKWALRKKVGELLSFSVGYKDISTFDQSSFGHNMKTRVLDIISLLEVSSRSGLVSPMNFSILRDEFSHLTHYLDEVAVVPAGNASTHSNLPQNFFDVPPPPSVAKPGISSGLSHAVPSHTPHSHIKDNSGDPEKNVLKRNSRQTIILQLIKKKKEITIGDVSEVIKNCSEKTIQRELISLIQSGVLKKTGERRWSKYSFI